jgi:hypothetical protein
MSHQGREEAQLAPPDARAAAAPTAASGTRLAEEAAAASRGRAGRERLAAEALALQRRAGNRVVARRLAPTPAGKRVLARQDAQEVMMGMMWQRMGDEISAMITGLFGGSAYVSPAQNKVEYSGPRGGWVV